MSVTDVATPTTCGQCSEVIRESDMNAGEYATRGDLNEISLHKRCAPAFDAENGIEYRDQFGTLTDCFGNVLETPAYLTKAIELARFKTSRPPTYAEREYGRLNQIADARGRVIVCGWTTKGEPDLSTAQEIGWDVEDHCKAVRSQLYAAIDTQRRAYNGKLVTEILRDQERSGARTGTG